MKIAEFKPDSSAPAGDFQAWMGGVQSRMESALARLLPAAQLRPPRLHEAMRYATLEGGKRVRPLLAFAAGEATGATSSRLEIAAAAVEMIHAYSLVHDDLPCMDDDVLRRGKPTVHLQYGEATAMLTGDALQALAFQVISEHRLADDAKTQLEMIRTLAAAAGSRGMAGGQQIDLEATGSALTVPELEWMHIHKTGALIRAAVLLGAYCGRNLDANHIKMLDRYAKSIGLAFQVVDDVLDNDSSTATLGKTVGKDQKQGKPTYVSAMGLAGARQLAQDLRGDAHAALSGLGAAGRRLGELADFIVLRKF